jgi:hypothetical protein
MPQLLAMKKMATSYSEYKIMTALPREEHLRFARIVTIIHVGMMLIAEPVTPSVS